MCKHIMFTEFNPDDLATLKLFASMTHDRDGFGAILRTKKGTIETLKSLDLASFYVDLTMRLARDDIRTLVVHHRTSTNGDGLDYAHPFEFQGHYLTHNGVVSVPGEHATKTANDSEALLHHLVKSDYTTDVVQGYYSCFVLTDTTTTVLVDRTAPIYASRDGRVYSSHRLNSDDIKLEAEKLTLCPTTGLVVNRESINVAESSYGMSQAHLSLGYSSGVEYVDDLPNYTYSRDLETFFACLTWSEEDDLYNTRDVGKLCEKIDDITNMLGLELNAHDKSEIIAIFQGEAA